MNKKEHLNANSEDQDDIGLRYGSLQRYVTKHENETQKGENAGGDRSLCKNTCFLIDPHDENPRKKFERLKGENDWMLRGLNIQKESDRRIIFGEVDIKSHDWNTQYWSLSETAYKILGKNEAFSQFITVGDDIRRMKTNMMSHNGRGCTEVNFDDKFLFF